jgi:ubiquinone/menaquinone biosynthesis C-methylase UbiE
VNVGGVEQALLEAAQLEPEEDVLVLGGGSLALAAHERIGDGWVYVVQAQVEELEELLGEAHAVGASGVAYLIGAASVLPLPDDAVGAALGRIAIDDGALGVAAEELARVLTRGRAARARTRGSGVRRTRGRHRGRGGCRERPARLRSLEPDDEPVSHPR